MNFSISEFCIVPDKDIPVDVADKILKYHIAPMIPFRESCGFSITASQRSGYRPRWYELEKDRSGNSQHCFDGKGAIDWTSARKHLMELLNWLKKESQYTRVAYYPDNGFIHCDYKKTEDGKRHFYHSTPSSVWTLKEIL